MTKKIQVLGTGCKKCVKLKELCDQAVSELGLDAEVIKVQDIMEITSFGVMMTPALAVDGEVRVAGKVPDLDEVKRLVSLES